MGATFVSTFFEQTRKLSDRPSLRYKRNGEWAVITWTEYEDLVRRAAGGLRALGLDAGDKAAIFSANRYEWHVADIAIQSVGGITVPIYPTNSPPQAAYIAGHSEAKAVFCENAAQLQKILEKRADLPGLEKAIVFTPDGVTEDDFVMTWESLLHEGETFNAEHPSDIDEHVSAVKAEDLATLVYTSGTTGPPKGAMLTHNNIVWTCESLSKVLESEPNDRRLSYLPLSHIAERMTSHFQQVYLGFETWFATSIDTLREDLVACKPTVIFGVPRVWEKFYAGIMKLIESLPGERREAAEQAIQLGLKRVEAQQAGTTLPPELEEKYQEANNSLFALARAALGLNEARALVSGAAPINPEVLRFFHAIGLPIAEVYGQTEDSGPTSINRPERIKIGSVGPALEGVEVKIAPDGEVLVRGGNVGPGYYKDPVATKDLLDEEGWMHSGDIGELDEDGYLRITDRKKDLIITAAGKNVAPQVIENMLKYSPWISQVVVIGDRRPYLTALITLDQEKVSEFAEQKGIPFATFPELVQHPDVQGLVANAVAEVNENLARVEQIKKWHVLDRDFAMEAEEVTPTLKLRRRSIIDKSSDLIERMYS
ncbi:MAG: AMP-dependent synthetase/ligase [Actinomycetota bacterium]